MAERKIANHLKSAGKVLLVLILSAVIGVFLLMLVYMLPTASMKGHVAESGAIYEYEGESPALVEGYKSTRLDNYTDATMLAMAIYPSERSPLQAALVGERAHNISESLDDAMRVISYARGEEYPVEQTAYPRYWHGYLIFLKPLLLFFNVADIRMLNFFCQSILLLLIMVKLAEKGYKKEIAALFGGIMVINPLVTAVSFQNSTIYYIILFSLLYLLSGDRVFHNYCESKNCAYFFLIVGILTSYIDFLTYPLAALGLPLIWVIYFSKADSGKKRLGYIVKYSALFTIGYLGMFLMKWLAATLLTEQNVFLDAWNEIQILFTVGPEKDEGITILDGLWKNVACLANWAYGVLFIGFGIYMLVSLIKSKRKPLEGIKRYSVYLLIALFPFIHMLASTHAWYHCIFTYREFVVLVVAVLYMMLEMGSSTFCAAKEEG